MKRPRRLPIRCRRGARLKKGRKLVLAVAGTAMLVSCVTPKPTKLKGIQYLGHCDGKRIFIYPEAIRLHSTIAGSDEEDLKQLVIYHEMHHWNFWNTGRQSDEVRADKWAWQMFVRNFKREPKVKDWPH